MLTFRCIVCDKRIPWGDNCPCCPHKYDRQMAKDDPLDVKEIDDKSIGEKIDDGFVMRELSEDDTGDDE